MSVDRAYGSEECMLEDGLHNSIALERCES